MFLSGGLIPSSFNCSCAFDSAQVAVDAGDVEPASCATALSSSWSSGPPGLGVGGDKISGVGGGGDGEDPNKKWTGVLAKLNCIGLRSCAPACIYIYI